jgi:hypothetical protein
MPKGRGYGNDSTKTCIMAKMLQSDIRPAVICHDALPPEFSKVMLINKKDKKSFLLFKYEEPSFSNSINTKLRGALSLRLFITSSTNGQQKVTKQLLYNSKDFTQSAFWSLHYIKRTPLS